MTRISQPTWLPRISAPGATFIFRSRNCSNIPSWQELSRYGRSLAKYFDGRIFQGIRSPMPQKRVLVVADDRNTLAAIECWLAEAGGYDVVSAARFEDAKRYLASHTPDILLVEDRLGAFNGLQLAMSVRSAHPEVRVIVFSDNADAVLEREAERCGAQYVHRPESSASLFKYLEPKAGARYAPPL